MTEKKEFKNQFSWSFSRHNSFETCKRKYYYSYYGCWGGWDKNADEKITYMGTGEQGGGFFRTNNSKGEMTSYLGEGKDSRGGHLQTFNMKGEMTSYLGTSMHEAGSLEINNEYGIKVGSLGASFEQETYRGDGVIMLYDRTGEFGWMTDGKLGAAFDTND